MFGGNLLKTVFDALKFETIKSQVSQKVCWNICPSNGRPLCRQK